MPPASLYSRWLEIPQSNVLLVCFTLFLGSLNPSVHVVLLTAAYSRLGTKLPESDNARVHKTITRIQNGPSFEFVSFSAGNSIFIITDFVAYLYDILMI